MIRAGITGGIGSGKSTVAKIFALLGVPVYAADFTAKLILDEKEVIKKIAAFAGGEVVDGSGKIDRKKLAALVFNDSEKLALLNGIVHPAVGRHFDDWCARQKNVPYILKEAAILFESGAYRQVDPVITVTAPLALKISRTMQRDHLSQEEVEARMNNQISDAEKIKRSQYVVRNDEQSLLIPQVLEIHHALLKLAGGV